MASDPSRTLGIIPDWPDLPAKVGALASTRAGGFSNGPYDDGCAGGGLNLGQHVGDDPATVARNRARLAEALPGYPAFIWQVHGVAVVDAASVVDDGKGPDADASFATVPGAVCTVMTADCLPVLFADVDGKVVAAAHAGWRGLAAGVLHRTVAAMRAAGAGEITAWLGPAIGPGAFEVGREVADTFAAAAIDAGEAGRLRAAFVPVPGSSEKYVADIYALGRIFLARDGVVKVSGGERCTVRERDTFYSYRRDGVTGRQASMIWLRSSA